MGSTSPPRSSIGESLFTPVQLKVLALFFRSPDRRFRTAEVVETIDSGVGAAHRQLVRLADAGLLAVTRSGNQKLYQANRKSPVFEELRSLIAKTVGFVDPIADALRPLSSGITAAFIYGSIAKGTARDESDVDLMIVSDSIRYPDVMKQLERAEREIGRPVNPTLLGRAQWRARSGEDSFTSRVLAGDVIWIVGSAEVLT